MGYMDYFDCFEGGPVDGKKENSAYRDGKHPRLVCRQLVEVAMEFGMQRLAVYQHTENRKTEFLTERVYRYLQTIHIEEQHTIKGFDCWDAD